MHENESKILENNSDNDDFSRYSQTIKGWSWAGSFLTSWTFIVAKNWWMLILYFISFFIPFINFIALIFWFIYGWLKWKDIIYKSPRFINHDERVWALKAMEWFGFVTFILIVIWIIFYLTIWALFIWAILSWLWKQ